MNGYSKHVSRLLPRQLHPFRRRVVIDDGTKNRHREKYPPGIGPEIEGVCHRPVRRQSRDILEKENGQHESCGRKACNNADSMLISVVDVQLPLSWAVRHGGFSWYFHFDSRVERRRGEMSGANRLQGSRPVRRSQAEAEATSHLVCAMPSWFVKRKKADLKVGLYDRSSARRA